MEVAALDELIDKLVSATSEQQMAQVVAENIFAIDTKFWIRVATRNDTAATQAEKDRLQRIANDVMILVDSIIKKSEQQLNDSGKVSNSTWGRE